MAILNLKFKGSTIFGISPESNKSQSHLLAALLRANSIPAGLCYQRLTVANDIPPFCIHGLNAVYLEPYGWYRIDARGNKQGVNAVFNPPHEQLAFPIITEGEADFIEVWAKPLEIIVDLLESSSSYKEVADNLPDIQIVTANKPFKATALWAAS
jgi:transglutaminase-like putative cysteine protease